MGFFFFFNSDRKSKNYTHPHQFTQSHVINFLFHGTEWTDEDDYNFCDFLFELFKKKIPQGLRGKEYTNQFSLQSKGAVTVEDYWTECQYYGIVWVCFVFGNCNHCCFCCGHPFIMLGVSLFISCKNKIQCVCVCVCVKKKKMRNWCWKSQSN